MTPDQVVQVQAVARNILLCSWTRHITPTVPLSTQVYKWVLANLMLVIDLTLGSTNTSCRAEKKYSYLLYAKETGDKSEHDKATWL